MTDDEPICLIPNCKEIAICRYVCKSHYETMRARVAAGEITWAELAELGLIGGQMRESWRGIRQTELDNLIAERRAALPPKIEEPVTETV